MTTKQLTNVNLPDKFETELAQQSQRELAAYLSTKLETQKIEIMGEDQQSHTIELPTSAMMLLMEILGELAAGNAVQIVPVHAELTTQEAANILNVSRPHMVKLLEEGLLPFHKTGRHRRVLFADLIAYKRQRDQNSLEAMQALAEQAQELGMGY
ncbi:helix-turn-helix domain-containing protein [Photorhabdus khanii]|uniref:DNA-binding protein n=1 Tax=Photorhabdus khanii subsp. guanajuatensis TaxID=2100166 RepID=A0A4R4JQY1_9GAMM|nr:helix-turn-helix domain-containing protein [Photorhabdus khanii]TDB56833.1 DNA-binding protein [Photorhabdus khanii subsp. guanajuatensis]